jgi:hypothetical protein
MCRKLQRPLRAITLATILAILPAAAQAGPQTPPKQERPSTQPGKRGGRAKPDPLFTALDTDRDGALSAAELRIAAAVLKKFDKNNDGRLTRDEIAGGRGGKGKGAQRKGGNSSAQPKRP